MAAPGLRSGTTRRWRRTAALLILLPSLSTLVYAPLMPVPAGPQIIPLAAGLGLNILSILGLAGVAAAIGIWRGHSWGRYLGVVVTGLLLAHAAWMPLVQIDPEGDSLAMSAAGWLGSVVVPATCSGTILFALARRWDPVPSA